MQTEFSAQLLETPQGQRANEILRKCVHCGFCTATCPTYQLLGNELDSPRGRIYQIKQLLEGQPADREAQLHLDRCLTCRSCETTCPSGVDYAELVDIGRARLEQQNLRPFGERVMRKLLGALLPFPARHRLLFRVGSLFRGLLPGALKAKTPAIRGATSYPKIQGARTRNVLLLEGCVQSTISPNTNAAAVLLLEALGYNVIREPQPTCCGAVNHHLNQEQQAQARMIENIEKWRLLDRQYDLHAIISTASGCGVMLKDYPEVLAHKECARDPSQRTLCHKFADISELLDAETLMGKLNNFSASQQRIAYHAPCTLTHGHKQADPLRHQLEKLGYQLTVPRDAHLCCGSAGTYSILQADLSRKLQRNKIDALNEGAPDVIITANVGCEHHLAGVSDVPLRHWVEIVADDIARVV